MRQALASISLARQHLQVAYSQLDVDDPVGELISELIENTYTVEATLAERDADVDTTELRRQIVAQRLKEL